MWREEEETKRDGMCTVIGSGYRKEGRKCVFRKMAGRQEERNVCAWFIDGGKHSKKKTALYYIHVLTPEMLTCNKCLSFFPSKPPFPVSSSLCSPLSSRSNSFNMCSVSISVVSTYAHEAKIQLYRWLRWCCLAESLRLLFQMICLPLTCLVH